MNKFYIKIRNLRFVRIFVGSLQSVVLPGFDKMSLYEVLTFFVKGLLNGAITTRASSIAFKFFIAIFPAIIFLFTIIPYIPIVNFQEVLMQTIHGMLPQNFYNIVESTIKDIVMRQHGSLLSVGFFLTIYFSMNGIMGMITAFNSTTHSIETRSTVKKYLVSFFLVLIIAFILLLTIAAIVGGTSGLNYLVEHKILERSLTYYLLRYGKWILIIFMLFFAISCMYYLAPARKTRFRFISAGSTLATILFLLTTLGFNYYVNNFAKYNALYGSIGTLIVIMMWLYFNALVLLIGFELNASIANARMKREENEKSNIIQDSRI
jgi:membrane protein